MSGSRSTVSALALCTTLAARGANAHQPPPDWTTDPSPTPVTLMDAQGQTMGSATAYPDSIAVPTSAVDVQRVAFACWAPQLCRRVIEVLSCRAVNPNPQRACAEGTSALRLGPTYEQQRQPVFVPQWTPPNDAPPLPRDPCANRPIQREWAGHVTAGPEFAMIGLDPRMGVMLAPGFRRVVSRNPYRVENGPCAGVRPTLDDIPFSRVIGTEFGMDFRARVHWRLASPGGIVGGISAAPIGRIVLGERWRVPSILGALVPEVGYQMSSYRVEAVGAMAARDVTTWWLMLRPAGWAVGYVFAKYPRASVTVDAAPVFAVPLSGQRFELGFSATVMLEVTMW
jgi:hypothetical protein